MTEKENVFNNNPDTEMGEEAKNEEHPVEGDEECIQQIIDITVRFVFVYRCSFPSK